MSCFSAGKRAAMSMARSRRWDHEDELKLFVATLLHSTCMKVVVVGELEILYFKVRYTKEGRGGVADDEVGVFSTS